MTVREVVEQVAKDLGNINVPVSQMQNIGVPIVQAIQGLNAVIQAWDEEDKKKQEAKPDEPEIKLEVVPAEEVPEEIRNDTEE